MHCMCNAIEFQCPSASCELRRYRWIYMNPHGTHKPKTYKNTGQKFRSLKKTYKLKGKRSKEERNREQQKQPKNNEQNGNKNITISTLNVNGLNAPIQRHRVAQWRKESMTHLYAACKRRTLD